MPWSFSFLRKFSYASATFALFTACVSIQFGTVMMQFVDRVHCVFLKSLLTSPQFPISDAILARLGLKDYQYKCQIQIPPVEVQDDFGMRQLRQGCYCSQKCLSALYLGIDLSLCYQECGTRCLLTRL
mmetsp:Transcript_2555/g.8415  ORF Transcript_2555/g.8415 Transcript_2555/m.8415 type:complete len:128 (-) Transcript_2555:2224-2607(-)